MSASASWLRFIEIVPAAEPDMFLATFEVDGVPVIHEVEITTYQGIHGCAGTSFFAMMDRGWDDLEQKRLVYAEVSKMMSTALDITIGKDAVYFPIKGE